MSKSNDKNSEANKISSTDEDFIADSKSALLNKTTPLSNIILWVIALFVIGMLTWAYFAKIDQITVAEAKVIPSSQIKTIQSLDGGIIKEILVKEGAFVKPGQVLIYLDDTRYKADYQQGYQKYLALLGSIARLTAETADQNKIIFPAELTKEAPEIVSNETNQFETRKKAINAEIANLKQSYSLKQKQLDIMAPMVAKGIFPKIDYIRTESELNDISGKITQIQDDFYEKSWSELNDQKAQINEVIAALQSLKDKMIRTTIKSPVAGIVKKINIVTVGGVINPGMAIMDIVPVEDTLLVEAYVTPGDIAFVHVGQQATVKIKAYDYSIYGDLKGTVEHISADTIEDQKPVMGSTKPTIYYIIDVRTNKNYLGSSKHELPIIPGMTATVHIVTGHKTVLDYLLKPLLKAKEEALREK